MRRIHRSLPSCFVLVVAASCGDFDLADEPEHRFSPYLTVEKPTILGPLDGEPLAEPQPTFRWQAVSPLNEIEVFYPAGHAETGLAFTCITETGDGTSCAREREEGPYTCVLSPWFTPQGAGRWPWRVRSLQHDVSDAGDDPPTGVEPSPWAEGSFRTFMTCDSPAIDPLYWASGIGTACG